MRVSHDNYSCFIIVLEQIEEKASEMMKKQKLLNVGIFLLVIGLSACSMPDAGSGTTSDTTPPTITNLSTSSSSIYYNESSCGPTRLTISLNVSDDSGLISTVGLQYRYRTDNQDGSSLAWNNVILPWAGNGQFSGELDVDAEAGAVLGNGSGVFEYQVYAVDTAGNINTKPETTAKSLSVQHCSAGVTSAPVTVSDNSAPAPPLQPAGTSMPLGNLPTVTLPETSANPTQSSSGSSGGGGNSPQQPTATSQQPETFIGSLPQTPKGLDIKSINASPTAIYDGGCSDIGPTSTTFTVELISPEVLSKGQITYRYLKNGKTILGQDYGENFTYNGASIYTFDTKTVTDRSDAFLEGAEGQLEYWVAAQDTDGNWAVSDHKYVNVLPCSVVGNPVTAPYINYFTGTQFVYEGDTVILEWNVSDANCGVLLDGNNVNTKDSFSYVVPANTAPMMATHVLWAYGDDCNNPISVSATVDIQVAVKQTQQNLSAPLNAGISGSRDTDTFQDWYGSIVAGDEEHDHILMAVMQFDISSLPSGLELHSATLDLGPCTRVGSPVNIFPFSVSAASSSVGLRSVGMLNGTCSGTFDVSDLIFASLGDSAIAFMVTPAGTNYDGTPDQIFYSPTLTIVYKPNP